MKVLWITNILFPDIASLLGHKIPVTGGWMYSSAISLINNSEDIEIAVAAMGGGEKLTVNKIGRILYFCLPFPEGQIKYDSKIEEHWKYIHDYFKPDIVHIHGTEFSHGLAYLKIYTNRNVLISIQGLVSVYSRYSLGMIPLSELMKNRTLHDYLKTSILKLPQDMAQQGQLEIEYLSLARHVIGRTDWDRIHVNAINPKVNYHFCNETLRPEFYSRVWSLDNCMRHTIMISQAYKPIKGFHKLINALPLVLREFPDTKIFVTGIDFLSKKTLKQKLKFTTYAKYVNNLIVSNGLQEHIQFIGLQDANNIASILLNSNVFVCPSSIENSPNSLGEAQILGVPCIASYVGGIPNMISNGHDGLLYPFDEHEMLADCICKIFKNDDFAKSLSINGRNSARLRHDDCVNSLNILDIYNKILH